MQPARIKPHAKEHTNNPVQKPNFRGHAAGDVEVTEEIITATRGRICDNTPEDGSQRSGTTAAGSSQ